MMSKIYHSREDRVDATPADLNPETCEFEHTEREVYDEVDYLTLHMNSFKDSLDSYFDTLFIAAEREERDDDIMEELLVKKGFVNTDWAKIQMTLSRVAKKLSIDGNKEFEALI